MEWIRWRLRRPNLSSYYPDGEGMAKFRYDLTKWKSRRPRRAERSRS